jgi:hypothetical protein
MLFPHDSGATVEANLVSPLYAASPEGYTNWVTGNLVHQKDPPVNCNPAIATPRTAHTAEARRCVGMVIAERKPQDPIPAEVLV